MLKKNIESYLSWILSEVFSWSYSEVELQLHFRAILLNHY